MASHTMGLVLKCVFFVLTKPFFIYEHGCKDGWKDYHSKQVSALFTCRLIVASLGKNNLLSFIYQLMFLRTELLSALQ